MGTWDPTASPSVSPTTSDPTVSPSQSPSSSAPTTAPSKSPSSSAPTASPSQSPSSSAPTTSPSALPTTAPTASPSASPTTSPTRSPAKEEEDLSGLSSAFELVGLGNSDGSVSGTGIVILAAIVLSVVAVVVMIRRRNRSGDQSQYPLDFEPEFYEDIGGGSPQAIHNSTPDQTPEAKVPKTTTINTTPIEIGAIRKLSFSFDDTELGPSTVFTEI